MSKESMVNLIIDNKNVSVPEGTTILEAARKVNIDIPTLCFLKDINEVGDCRMCITEVEGRRGFATSCIQKVEEGMVVHTNSPAVVEARKTILDLILSNHHRDCLTCVRNGNCELQSLAEKLNMTDVRFDGVKNEYEVDDKSPSIVRDFNKCVLCRRCVATCKKVQNIGAISSTGRGFSSCISTVGNNSLDDVNCTFCGQCIESCPTGALHEKETINEDGSILTFDDYEFELFRYYILNSLKTKVERIWNRDTFINVTFDSEDAYYMFRPPVPKEINEYMLPKEMEPYWDYDIIVGEVTLNSENKQFVAEQIFKLYQEINDNDFNPNKIKILFKGQTQHEDSTLVDFYYTKETSINDILSVLNSIN